MAEEFFDKAHDMLPFRLTVEDTYGYLFNRYKNRYKKDRLYDDFDEHYLKVCKRLKNTPYEDSVRELLHTQIDEFFKYLQEKDVNVMNPVENRMTDYLEVLDYLNS